MSDAIAKSLGPRDCGRGGRATSKPTNAPTPDDEQARKQAEDALRDGIESGDLHPDGSPVPYPRYPLGGAK